MSEQSILIIAALVAAYFFCTKKSKNTVYGPDNTCGPENSLPPSQNLTNFENKKGASPQTTISQNLEETIKPINLPAMRPENTKQLYEPAKAPLEIISEN